MTQDNPSSNPDPTPPGDDREEEPGKPAPKPPAKKRHWVRRIVYTLLILIVGLIVLVALAPMILSSAAGRNFVIGKVNQNLNGHVSVADWSIGWTSGIHADDVKVFDEAGKTILQIPRFSTDLSLLSAIRGNIHLGDTVVKGLNFFVERYPDGTLNFDRLAKASPKTSQKSERPATSDKKEPGKLPAVDGKLQLIDCHGTFQDDLPDHTHKTVDFPTIAGDVNIPSINGTIQDSLQIIANLDGHEIVNVNSGGKLLIAKDNVMLPPGQMNIQQNLQLSADLAKLQEGFGSGPSSAAKFTKGTVKTDIEVIGDATALRIKPTVNASDVALVSDGVPDPIGPLVMAGEIVLNYKPASDSSAGKSPLDQIASVQFNNYRFLGVGSGLALNGLIEDPLHARKFKNLTLGLDYNSGMLWNALLPLLSKETRESLNGTKVAGNFTDKKRKVWTFNGPFPADKPFNEAIVGFSASGEIALDLLDSNGATLSDFVVPFTLAGGKLRLAYPKGSSREYAEPAHLNGGTLSFAGLEVDLTQSPPTLSAPDNTQFLHNVGLNPVFADTVLGGDLNNPLFSGADKAAGLVSMNIAHCANLPMDQTITLNVPTNKGVLELNLTIANLQIGSVLLAKLSEAMGPLKSLAGLAGSNLKLDILRGDVSDFNVLIQNGITKQHMMMTVGDRHERGLKLSGTVVMQTRMMNMVIALPMSTFGLKSGNAENDIQIPLSGPVNKPEVHAQDAVKNVLKHIKGIPDISNLFGKAEKSTTKPADQGTDNALDLLGNLLGKKKDKNKANPDNP